MTEKKKKKKTKREIVVDTSFLKGEEELLRDTTEMESHTVSRASITIGQYLSWTMIGIGAFTLFFSLFLFIDVGFTFLGSEIQLNVIFSILGSLNIVCGLLLITRG